MKLDSQGSLVHLLTHLIQSPPKMLRQAEPEFDVTLIAYWLGKDLAAKFWSALRDLRVELVPQHARDTDVLNAFWDELVCEVSASPESYLERPDALDDLVDRFGNRWKKPLSEYEVMYSIDYLDVGQEPIALVGVEFFAPTDEALAQRNISKSEVARWSKSERNQTFAVVRTLAASIDIAFQAGLDRVVDAVSLMKVSALRGLASRTATDELIQWKLSGWYLARPFDEGNPTDTTLWAFHRQFGPSVDDLGTYIRRGIDELKLELLRKLPEDVRERVIRSMYWIAHSAAHDTDDHKLVDLCTALEILLLPEGRKVSNKGTFIALRYNLLGGDLNPSAVKWMYDRRNDVIHGNQLPVVEPRDTWHLRLVCYTVLPLAIVRASAGKPEGFTLVDLIGTLETEKGLMTFVDRVDKRIYEGTLLPGLAKEARKKLKKLRRVS